MLNLASSQNHECSPILINHPIIHISWSILDIVCRARPANEAWYTNLTLNFVTWNVSGNIATCNPPTNLWTPCISSAIMATLFGSSQCMRCRILNGSLLSCHNEPIRHNWRNNPVDYHNYGRDPFKQLPHVSRRLVCVPPRCRLMPRKKHLLSIRPGMMHRSLRAREGKDYMSRAWQFK